MNGIGGYREWNGSYVNFPRGLSCWGHCGYQGELFPAEGHGMSISQTALTILITLFDSLTNVSVSLVFRSLPDIPSLPRQDRYRLQRHCPCRRCDLLQSRQRSIHGETSQRPSRACLSLEMPKGVSRPRQVQCGEEEGGEGEGGSYSVEEDAVAAEGEEDGQYQKQRATDSHCLAL